MLFSANVSQADCLTMHRVTRMKVVENLGKYLGLSSHFSRSKNSDLNFLKERVQKVIAGWKEIFFSIGGKEVLIKAVVQAIPTYVMSCIRIPTSLCDSFTNMIAKFWWVHLLIIAKFTERPGTKCVCLRRTKVWVSEV